jgi:hypothetical protein
VYQVTLNFFAGFLATDASYEGIITVLVCAPIPPQFGIWILAFNSGTHSWVDFKAGLEWTSKGKNTTSVGNRIRVVQPDWVCQQQD